MHEAAFYTPSDFKEGNSEQHLSVYQEKLSAYPSMSRLSVFRALLNNELGIRIERPKEYDNWNLPGELELEGGNEEVEHYFRLVVNPAPLERFDVSPLKHFWKLRDDWNDVVIVGTASDDWFVLHWYTTA